MSIDTMKTTTMVIGLTVAVLLVAGVLVPVISSSLESNSEGAAYTNTGNYYYKEAKEGENHTLAIDSTDDAVTVTFDGVLIHTLTKGFEGWSLPLFSYVLDGYEGLCSLYYY